MEKHDHNHSSSPRSDVLYTCPMHPEITDSKPGLCPECGMNLVKSKTNESHDKHAGHSTQSFLKKFWVSLVLTAPVVVYSFGRGHVFNGSAYLPAVLGSVVFFYGGWIFIKGAWLELRGRQPGMMTLIGLAVTVAYAYSILVTLGNAIGPAFAKATADKHDLFWELTTLITVMLLGHWLEMKAVKGAQGALKELSKLLPDTAELVRGDQTETIPLNQLKERDIVLVRPGGKIPADGKVIEGESEVNESLLTGESQPIRKKIASAVVAGAINGEGSLKIEITQIGEHTFLAGVMRLVAEAQSSKSNLQLLSDRAAFYLTIVAIASGGLTFVLWLISQAGFSFALERLVAVLVIACPHALGLAIPLVASISTTLAAGVLASKGLLLQPAVAAVFMSLSTVIVAFNAVLLKRIKL